MVSLFEKKVSGWCLPLLLGGMMGCSNTPVIANGDEQPDTVKASVSVIQKDSTVWKPLAYDSTKQYIYLTFDDGPQHGTVTCYDICRQEGVKASFFMVGQHTELKSDGRKIVAMIRDAYPHTVLANHSYSHAYNKYLNFYHHADSALRDFLHAQELLHPRWKIIRLPGNRSWVRAGEVKATALVRPVAHLLDSAGFNVIGWDLEWGFRKKTARPVQTPEQLANQADSAFTRNETHMPHHLVILTHDRMFRHPEDAEALRHFIQILKRNPHYVFETVDHYPGLKKLE